MAKVLAQALVPGDKIIVNIAAVQNAPNGQSRLPIGAEFNGNGQRVGPDGFLVAGARGLTLGAAQGTQPQFPLQAYRDAMARNDRATADRLYADHQTSLAQWEGAGGQLLPDRIGQAVFNWARDEFRLSTDDNDRNYVLKPDHITVKPTYRDGDQPTVFVVQLNPIWG